MSEPEIFWPPRKRVPPLFCGPPKMPDMVGCVVGFFSSVSWRLELGLPGVGEKSVVVVFYYTLLAEVLGGECCYSTSSPSLLFFG
jgi:hypothetical protein